MPHAENLILIYFLGGGIFLDSLKRQKIYGLEKFVKNQAKLNNVRVKNVKLKKKMMNLIYSERTLRRINRLKRSLKS
jgi:hypothetical protein